MRTVRANLILSEGTRVCSEHFSSDYLNNSTLDPQAVPTIFPSKKPKVEIKRRTNPLDAKRKIELFEESLPKVQKVCEGDVESVVPASDDCTVLTKDTQTDEPFRFGSCKKCSATRPLLKEVGCQTVLPDITASDLKGDDKKTRFFTGFINFGTFLIFYQTLVEHFCHKLNYWDGETSLTEKKYQISGTQKPGPSRQLTTLSEFLMTMIWYRLGLVEEHLAFMFKVSIPTVSRILTTWTQFIYEHSVGLVSFPSREQVLLNLPPHFINHSNVILVLDCTEFWLEKPSGLEAQCCTWSEYKHHNTIKSLIGCTPDGMTIFVSNAWGGRASDRHIVQAEDVLQLVPEGMAVMADKGFEVHDLAPNGVDIIIPPKVSTKEQMSDSDFYKTLGIAEARIVVEMKMEQAKNYRILQVQFPMSRIGTAQQVIFNCFALTNLLPPLLAPATSPEDTLELPLYSHKKQ